MPSPPIFQRAPRIPPEIPKGEVDIPAPPPVPAQPTTSVMSSMLPRLTMVGGVGAVALGGLFTGVTQNPLWLVSMFGMAGAGVVTALFAQRTQKKNYEQTVKTRNERYRALLEARRQELSAQRDRQFAALLHVDPAPEEDLARVERRDRLMWQRSPKDPDFLSLRVGLGQQPFSISIRPPRDDSGIGADPLLQEAQALAQEFAYVSDAPVNFPLREAGVGGIAGPYEPLMNAARAVAFQIAAHHSPDEVKICALFRTEDDEEWAWMRWLPHVWTGPDPAKDRKHRLLASEKDAALRMQKSLHDMLNRRRLQMSTSAARGEDVPPPLPYIVFFLSDSRLMYGPLMHMLVTEGPEIGALPIFLADSIENLPKSCQAILELPREGREARLIQTAPTVSQKAVLLDDVSVDMAERMGRAMSPVRLRRIVAGTDVPDRVPLLDILGDAADSVEELDILSRWKGNEGRASLAVPIGKRAGGELLNLDLHERAHGPHGLVAGTTGSGKSELLQTLVASLAANFHPHHVAFALVDYKAGGMSDAFRDLPHLVGAITNLEGAKDRAAIVTRTLVALRSELQRRLALLSQAGENHIDRYQQRYRNGELTQPLPHLVIIVDEFAELEPEFMKELISVARLGRSPGMHLILATQKPGGVVNEQIWSNARFRICLRVERPEDSRDVLKRPDAASITQVGRAYLQVGNDEIFELFQSAWGGVSYAPGVLASADPEEVVEVALDGSRHALRLSPRPLQIQASGNQLQALVSHIQQLVQQEGVPPVKGPWLPPLPEHVALPAIRSAGGWRGPSDSGSAAKGQWEPVNRWMEPVIGLVDDPARQFQGPLSLNLGQEGHLAIYGVPGSGKTLLLQTLLTSLALDHSPRDLNIYVLDFGGRNMVPFAGLPHVGGVVLPDEAERVSRLLRYLLKQVEARQRSFAQAGVSSLQAYRAAHADPMPAIVVVLENYTGFDSLYPDAKDQLAQLVRDGGSLGIHLVVTANSPADIKSSIRDNITSALALRLAEKAHYTDAMQFYGVPEPAHLPGRGLVRAKPPLEFQTAFPVEGDTEAQRTLGLKELIREMVQAWDGPKARPVPVLPEAVPLCDVLPSSDGWPLLFRVDPLAVPLGLDVDDLEPVEVDLPDGPHFLVLGPVGSGKTTLLQTWTLSLAERLSPERLHLYLVDYRRYGLLPLQRLPQVKAYIEDDDKLSSALAEITRVLHERRGAVEEARQRSGGVMDEHEFVSNYPTIVLVMDDYDALREGQMADTKSRLDYMIRRERGLGFHVLLAGLTNDIGSSFESWIKALREGQTGFLLGSSDTADARVLNFRVPYGEADKLLHPGQGYYSRRGRLRKIKVATPHAGPLQMREWVARIASRDA